MAEVFGGRDIGGGAENLSRAFAEGEKIRASVSSGHED